MARTLSPSITVQAFGSSVEISNPDSPMDSAFAASHGYIVLVGYDLFVALGRCLRWLPGKSSSSFGVSFDRLDFLFSN